MLVFCCARARIAVCLTLAAACADSPETSSVVSRHAPLVYGEDDRREVFQAAAAPPLDEAARAVAAVIPRSNLRRPGGGPPEIYADSLEQAENVCASEAFAQQPSAAECTAVLIDDNLLATAGHCFRHAWDCESYAFVFGYAYASEGELAPLEFYDCTRALVRENDLPEAGERVHDYAIVELTRAVAGRTPISLRQDTLEPGEPLTVISATSGVPLKVDPRARVLDARVDAGDYFRLESDTFHGSSGAPVLDAVGALAAVFVRGDEDYVFDESAGCYAVVRLPSSTIHETEPGGDAGEASPPAHGEQAGYLRPAIEALCQTGYPSLRLCGIEPRCGDAVCSPNESHASCAEDCAAADSPASDAGAVSRPPRPVPDAGAAANAAGITAEDAGAAAEDPGTDTEDAGTPAYDASASEPEAPDPREIRHSASGCSATDRPAFGSWDWLIVAGLLWAAARPRPRTAAARRPSVSKAL
jgi:hypothetical protein